jgi:hypothetical protein
MKLIKLILFMLFVNYIYSTNTLLFNGGKIICDNHIESQNPTCTVYCPTNTIKRSTLALTISYNYYTTNAVISLTVEIIGQDNSCILNVSEFTDIELLLKFMSYQFGPISKYTIYTMRPREVDNNYFKLNVVNPLARPNLSTMLIDFNEGKFYVSNDSYTIGVDHQSFKDGVANILTSKFTYRISKESFELQAELQTQTGKVILQLTPSKEINVNLLGAFIKRGGNQNIFELDQKTNGVTLKDVDSYIRHIFKAIAASKRRLRKCKKLR